jgi:hypothetical protein
LPATQVERKAFPNLGRIVAEQTAGVEAAEKAIEEGDRTRLY